MYPPFMSHRRPLVLLGVFVAMFASCGGDDGGANPSGNGHTADGGDEGRWHLAVAAFATGKLMQGAARLTCVDCALGRGDEPCGQRT